MRVGLSAGDRTDENFFKFVIENTLGGRGYFLFGAKARRRSENLRRSSSRFFLTSSSNENNNLWHLGRLQGSVNLVPRVFHILTKWE